MTVSTARRMFELVELIGVIPYSMDEPNAADLPSGDRRFGRGGAPHHQLVEFRLIEAFIGFRCQTISERFDPSFDAATLFGQPPVIADQAAWPTSSRSRRCCSRPRTGDDRG